MAKNLRKGHTCHQDCRMVFVVLQTGQHNRSASVSVTRLSDLHTWFLYIQPSLLWPVSHACLARVQKSDSVAYCLVFLMRLSTCRADKSNIVRCEITSAQQDSGRLKDIACSRSSCNNRRISNRVSMALAFLTSLSAINASRINSH